MEDGVESKIPKLLSCRYVMAYIGFLGFVFIHVMSFNFSIAIVCMVDNTTNSTAETFQWNRELQGYMLGSFFYGYVLAQLPSGILADRYGGKLVFFVGMIASAIATLLVHVGAGSHYGTVMALRFVTGLGTGVAFPCMHSLWARWAPRFERTRLITLTYSGTHAGTVLAYFISGLLCESSIGWPSIFYLTGGFCLLWCVVWWFGVHNTPEEHPFIKRAEKRYIQQHVTEEGNVSEAGDVPWGKILTSLPVWAICAAHTAQMWMGYTLYACTPMYMSDVLNFDIKSNGIYSSIAYAASFVSNNVFSCIADVIRKRGVRTVFVRKGAQTLSCLIGIVSMVTLGFLNSSQATAAMAILTLCAIGGSLVHSGFVVNHVDIAPRYAGLLYGLSNTFSTSTGILTPMVVGQLTPDRSREQWQVVFLVCAGVLLVGNVFFVVFGAGEEQEWAKSRKENSEELEESL